MDLLGILDTAKSALDDLDNSITKQTNAELLLTQGQELLASLQSSITSTSPESLISKVLDQKEVVANLTSKVSQAQDNVAAAAQAAATATQQAAVAAQQAASTVFDSVTNQVISTPIGPPPIPNVAICTQITDAFGVPFSSTGGAAPTSLNPATLASMSQTAIDHATSANLSPTQLNDITSAVGDMAGLGSVPKMCQAVVDHSNYVIDNGYKITKALNETFQPKKVYDSTRDSSLGDFLGTVQGKYASTLDSIQVGISSISDALLSIPNTIINGLHDAINSLISAITSGLPKIALDGAISGLGLATGSLTDKLGGGAGDLMKSIGSSASSIDNAVKAERTNIDNAIANASANPYKIDFANTDSWLKGSLTAEATKAGPTGPATPPAAVTPPAPQMSSAINEPDEVSSSITIQPSANLNTSGSASEAAYLSVRTDYSTNPPIVSYVAVPVTAGALSAKDVKDHPELFVTVAQAF